MSLPTEQHKFEQVAQQLAPGGRLHRTWPLTGGISADMTALEIERSDGSVQKAIVRRPGAGALRHNPHAAQDEFGRLRQLRALGLATPEPYLLDLSGAIFPAPYLVTEYIEGAPEFLPAELPDFARQIATHLAQIHQVSGESLDSSLFPPQASECAELAGRPAQLDESLGEGRIRAALQAAWPLLRRNTPALLHGDFWPGNLLWQGGALVAVIDWEDAHVGEPLADLAISRLDMLWIFGAEAMRSFTNQYQSLIVLDYSALPCWDLCAALRLARLAGADLAEWAAFFTPFGRGDITAQTIRAHYRVFVEQALDMLAG